MIVKLYQAEKVPKDTDTFPVVMAKTGLSKFKVGAVENGKLVAVTVRWTEDALTSLKERLEKKGTIKSFAGHMLPPKGDDGRIHRDIDGWIATVKGPYEIKDDDNGKGNKLLIGQMQVHKDAPKGQLLFNRIQDAPTEVKFSLDYSAKMKPVKEGNRSILRIDAVKQARSLDWVPESGFDNGLYVPSLLQSAQEAIEKFFNEKEGNVMNLEELKEKHPVLYQSIFDDGKTKGKEEAAKATPPPPSDDSRKVVDFKDTEEYKTLHQANVDLKKQNDELGGQVLQMGKSLTILEEREKSQLASVIQTKVLADHSEIPKHLHAKVKTMVRWQDFVGENGTFELGTDAVTSFQEAFEKELEDWVAPDPASKGGPSVAKSDGVDDVFQTKVDAYKKDLESANG
jgi:hypothetical protein